MNKGQYTIGHKWLYFIVALFMLSFMFIYLKVMISDYEATRLECVDEVVDEVILAKLLYDDTCFTYYDEDLAKAIPGTLDKSKLTQENYDKCFEYIEKKVKIVIEDIEIGEEIFTPKTIKKFVYLYDEGQTTPTTVSFTFANPTC